MILLSPFYIRASARIKSISNKKYTLFKTCSQLISYNSGLSLALVFHDLLLNFSKATCQDDSRLVTRVNRFLGAKGLESRSHTFPSCIVT